MPTETRFSFSDSLSLTPSQPSLLSHSHQPKIPPASTLFSLSSFVLEHHSTTNRGSLFSSVASSTSNPKSTSVLPTSQILTQNSHPTSWLSMDAADGRWTAAAVASTHSCT